MDIYKKVNIGIVVAFTILGVWATLYFGPSCTLVNCSSGFREIIFQTISIAFVIHGIVFLMLPAGYFKAWLKTVLSWALPLSMWVAYHPLTLGTVFRFNMMEAVKLMTYFVSVVTVLFILIRFVWLFIQVRKQK